MPQRRLVTLVGPTGSGKTDLAIRASRRSGRPIEIVALDSRQLYRSLNVGTGKPDSAQRRLVPHHLLDVLELDEAFDAARYRRAVESLLPRVWDRGAVPFFVGGAGFYLRALQEGFYALPHDPLRLAQIRGRLQSLSDDELWSRLSAADARMAELLHPHDRYRVSRALELLELSGHRPSELRQRFEPLPVLGCAFDVVHLSPERPKLHEHIAARTDLWLRGGWYEEVRMLLDRGWDPGCPGLSILGYREIVSVLSGVLDPESARERIVVATRRYARQQETWFRKCAAVVRGRAHEAALEAKLVELLERASR
jgi:tRNA dimethylallyltransferase